MSENVQVIYTIGHSTNTLQLFLALLGAHKINAVADVRSSPYSRFNPQFNKNALERDLKAHGIRYVFLGRELGARSEDPSCYEGGRVQYSRLARTDLFRSGVERVLRGASDYRVALMCAEREPLECHRTLLVARALKELGVAVRHILADGRAEPHEESMARLLDIVGLPRADMFRSREELIAEALSRQEERVAWVNPKQTADAARDTP
jgi:uncharacterized protein (DUF488 family)